VQALRISDAGLAPAGELLSFEDSINIDALVSGAANSQSTETTGMITL
jgi:hypothetical protein